MERSFPTNRSSYFLHLAGEGYWECVKEVLGWIIDTKAGTVALPERKLQELRYFLIPSLIMEETRSAIDICRPGVAPHHILP